MTNWKVVRLEKLTDLKSGFAFKTSQWKDAGVPVVKIGNVKQGQLDLSACSFVSRDDAKASKFLLKRGDILIGLTGYVGSVCRVKTDDLIVLNQRVGVFRPNTEEIDQDFLYFVLSSFSFKDRVISAAHGSAQANVSPKQILDFEISVPTLSEQRSIAAIFSALDHKIELNRKTAATLEEMARTLYRSWFVDFDPVWAKSQGQAPAHMDAATAALFPDRFGDDGLPEGWAEVSLDKIAIFLNGLALQKYPAVEGKTALPVIKIAELRNGITANSGWASADIPERFIVKAGDIVFSWSGSLLQKVWTEGTGALNQHLFKVWSDQVPKWFHYFAVDQHMEDFRSVAASKATTMGHIQRHHLSDAKIALPDAELLNQADKLVAPVFERLIQMDLESKTLTTLRDTLLPKLMSGEIRVGEALEQVEEVA